MTRVSPACRFGGHPARGINNAWSANRLTVKTNRNQTPASLCKVKKSSKVSVIASTLQPFNSSTIGPVWKATEGSPRSTWLRKGPLRAIQLDQARLLDLLAQGLRRSPNRARPRRGGIAVRSHGTTVVASVYGPNALSTRLEATKKLTACCPLGLQAASESFIQACLRIPVFYSLVPAHQGATMR